MHDVAEKYYADAEASMDRFRSTVSDASAQLMAELMAHKVAFDAEWVRRMREFKGEVPEITPGPGITRVTGANHGLDGDYWAGGAADPRAESPPPAVPEAPDDELLT